MADLALSGRFGGILPPRSQRLSSGQRPFCERVEQFAAARRCRPGAPLSSPAAGKDAARPLSPPPDRIFLPRPPPAAGNPPRPAKSRMVSSAVERIRQSEEHSSELQLLV